MAGDHSIPAFTRLADLASARVGGRAILANDDFFAPRSNLLKAEPAIFIPGKFTARGKWMDGWESRRRRTPGHDWCVVAARHARRGPRRRRRHQLLHRQLPVALLDRRARHHPRRRTRRWPRRRGRPGPRCSRKSPLSGNSHNYFTIAAGVDAPWTHLRLNIFPDGGVARLRVYGDVAVDWAARRGDGRRRSISRRSGTAASCSARATCTSARRTT